MSSSLLRSQPESSPSPPSATHPAPCASLASRALGVWWKVLGLAPSNTSPATHAAIIAGAMFVVAAVSWGRLAVRGTLSQVGDGVISAGHWTWMASLLAVALYLAGRSFAHVAYYGTADLSIRRIVLLGAAVHAASLPALPLLSGDVYVNLATGRLLNLGFDPLIHPPAALPADDPFRAVVVERWRNTVTPYGPLLIWFHAPAAAAGSVVGGLIVFKLLFAALVAFLLWVAARYALCEGATPAARTGLAMAAWNPISSSEFLGQLHSDVFPVAAAMAFVWCATVAHRGGVGVGRGGAVQQVRRLARRRLVSRLPRAAASGVCGRGGGDRRGDRSGGVPAVLVRNGDVRRAARGRVERPRTPLRHCGHAAVRSGAPARRTRRSPRRGSKLGVSSSVWRRSSWRCTWCAKCAVERRRSSAFVFTLAYLTCGTGWVMPWYAAWLIPWMAAIRTPGAVRAGACFTALAPILYMPDAAELRTVVFTVAVHLTPWCAWWRHERAQRLCAAEPGEVVG